MFSFFKFCAPVLFFLLAASPTQAAQIVARVTDGRTFSLEDGTLVRLADIQTPSNSGLSSDARAFLEKHLLGKPVEFANEKKDRYGRVSANVFVLEAKDKKRWIQKDIVNAGFAFVYPTEGSAEDIAALYKEEKIARFQKRGLWQDEDFADLSAEDASSRLGEIAFVVGIVRAVTKEKDKVYLNFGDDWKTDFTISLGELAQLLFKGKRFDLETFVGKRVRVRGFVSRYFGPMISVTHSDQIEILPPAAPQRK